MEEQQDVYRRALGRRDDIEDDIFREIVSGGKPWRRHPGLVFLIMETYVGFSIT
jgi:hypothetical protein